MTHFLVAYADIAIFRVHKQADLSAPTPETQLRSPFQTACYHLVFSMRNEDTANGSLEIKSVWLKEQIFMYSSLWSVGLNLEIWVLITNRWELKIENKGWSGAWKHQNFKVDFFFLPQWLSIQTSRLTRLNFQRFSVLSRKITQHTDGAF